MDGEDGSIAWPDGKRVEYATLAKRSGAGFALSLTRIPSFPRHQKAAPLGAAQIALFNAMGFLVGIAIVWMHAAIRPRYGAGPRTALCAAAATWFLPYALPSIGQ